MEHTTAQPTGREVSILETMYSTVCAKHNSRQSHPCSGTCRDLLQTGAIRTDEPLHHTNRLPRLCLCDLQPQQHMSQCERVPLLRQV